MKIRVGLLIASFVSSISCIPGKTNVFHIVDNPESPWTWVDRLSDRYKFNAAQQQVLHQHLLLNYLRPIPRPPYNPDPEHPLTILFWSKEGFEGLLANTTALTENCPVPCKVTTDQSQIGNAHMILTTGLEAPEEAFSTLQPHQLPALFVLEPDLSLPDASHRLRSFRVLTSYSRHSDVRIDYSRSLSLPVGRPNLARKTNRALAAAFISNCESNGDARYRMDYLRELRVHMDVDSYGSCLHTAGLPTTVNFQETADQYYFVLVFENSMLDDYITDKFYEALATDAIPVYLGAPNVSGYLPDPYNQHIIIEARHYADPANLASFLKKLAANPSDYLQYFEWRDRPIDKAFSKKLDFEAIGPDSFACRMCQYYDTHSEK